jgi:hypothetical protein
MVNVVKLVLSKSYRDSFSTSRGRSSGVRYGDVELEQKSENSEAAKKQSFTQIPVGGGTMVSLDKFGLLYKTEPLIFQAINIRADEICSRGYDIIPHPNDKSDANAKFCDEFMTKTGMKGLLMRKWIVNTDIYGTAWLEIVRDGDKEDSEATDLVLVNSTTVDYKREYPGGPIKIVDKEGDPRFGLPEGIVQNIGQNQIPLDINNIVKLTFNTIGDELLGIPLTQPIYKTVERLMNIEEGLAEAIYRIGYSKMYITYGNRELQIKSTPELQKEAEDVARKFVTQDILVIPNDKFTLNVLNPNAVNPNVLMDPYINKIVAGTGVPKVKLMGIGEGTNKATADVEAQHFAYVMKSLQLQIATTVQNDIFKRILKKDALLPQILWHEIMEDSDTNKVDMIYKLYTPPSPLQEPLISQEEARAMLLKVIDLEEGTPNEMSEKQQTESLVKTKLKLSK